MDNTLILDRENKDQEFINQEIEYINTKNKYNENSNDT